MGMKYKGLLLDIDGTIVRKDHMLTKRVEKAIKSIANKVKVGICSGRPLCAYRRYLNQLGLTGVHVSLGGAELVEFPSEKVVSSERIKETIVREIYRVMSQAGCVVILQDSKYQYQDLRRILDPNFPADFRPLRALKSWQVPKMVIYGLDEQKWKLLAQFTDVYIVKFRYRDLPLDFADVTAPGATKQEGVLQWLRYTGLKREEVVAVGDGYNDVPLLNAVGLKIAMGNAVDEVKAMADFVCPSVDEDGVATVIEKFFN